MCKKRIYGYCVFLENIQLKNVFKISIDPSLSPEHCKWEKKGWWSLSDLPHAVKSAGVSHRMWNVDSSFIWIFKELMSSIMSFII